MKTLLAIFVLCIASAAQILTLGPLVTPDKCVPDPVLTSMCFATDGAHVSFGGQPFTGPLPAQGPKGDKGDPGKDGATGPQGVPGIQGIPGKDAVFPQTITLTCLSGFGGPTHTSKCTVSK